MKRLKRLIIKIFTYDPFYRKRDRDFYNTPHHLLSKEDIDEQFCRDQMMSTYRWLVRIFLIGAVVCFLLLKYLQNKRDNADSKTNGCDDNNGLVAAVLTNSVPAGHGYPKIKADIVRNAFVGFSNDFQIPVFFHSVHSLVNTSRSRLTVGVGKHLMAESPLPEKIPEVMIITFKLPFTHQKKNEH